MDTQSMMKMLIFILTLIFSISNPKSIFRQIWAKKVKIIMFMILFPPPITYTIAIWATVYLMLYLRFVSLWYYKKKIAWKLAEYLKDSDSYSNISFLDFQS